MDFLYARTPYMLPFMKMVGFGMTYPAHVHDLGDRFWGKFTDMVDDPDGDYRIHGLRLSKADSGRIFL